MTPLAKLKTGRLNSLSVCRVTRPLRSNMRPPVSEDRDPFGDRPER